jgi:regulator of replication initiation timing
MSSLSEVVDSLEYRITTLLKQYEDVKQKQVLLYQEVTALQHENEQLKSQLDVGEQKYKTLKTANALLGSNEYKRETKLKINALVREIDACIVTLSE